jgi:pilus assembly protein Flp/PilA
MQAAVDFTVSAVTRETGASRVGSASRWLALALDERGGVGVEYALVGTLIALVIITGILLLGSSLQEIWQRVARCIVSPATCDKP